MSGRRSTGRSRSSSSRPRAARSRSRSSHRTNLEEMRTMLRDTYKTAAARPGRQHYKSPPIRDVFIYEDDPDSTVPVANRKRNLRRLRRDWNKFLESNPDTVQDDANLTEIEELRRRSNLLKADANKRKGRK